MTNIELRLPRKGEYKDDAGWYAAEVAYQVALKHEIEYPEQINIEAGINAAFWPDLDKEMAEKLVVMLDTMFG